MPDGIIEPQLIVLCRLCQKLVLLLELDHLLIELSLTALHLGELCLELFLHSMHFKEQVLDCGHSMAACTGCVEAGPWERCQELLQRGESLVLRVCTLVYFRLWTFLVLSFLVEINIVESRAKRKLIVSLAFDNLRNRRVLLLLIQDVDGLPHTEGLLTVRTVLAQYPRGLNGMIRPLLRLMLYALKTLLIVWYCWQCWWPSCPPSTFLLRIIF